MLMGASATRGALTFTPGAAVRPVSANSSTSGGYSPEVRFICSANASSTMLTTKSCVYSILRIVSFFLSSRRPEENASVGGLLHTAMKKLNGARLGIASSLRLDTQAIGRGTTQPMSSLYIDCGTAVCGSICMYQSPFQVQDSRTGLHCRT